MGNVCLGCGKGLIQGNVCYRCSVNGLVMTQIQHLNRNKLILPNGKEVDK
jgi:hypothetical protein